MANINDNSPNNDNSNNNNGNNSDNEVAQINRQIVWDSLVFLASQRTKSLMKINLIRRNKKALEKVENIELGEARRIKNRILKEIDINMKLFTDDDRNKLGLNNREDE